MRHISHLLVILTAACGLVGCAVYPAAPGYAYPTYYDQGGYAAPYAYVPDTVIIGGDGGWDGRGYGGWHGGAGWGGGGLGGEGGGGHGFGGEGRR
jgi:hypothetical protein